MRLSGIESEGMIDNSIKNKSKPETRKSDPRYVLLYLMFFLRSPNTQVTKVRYEVFIISKWSVLDCHTLLFIFKCLPKESHTNCTVKTSGLWIEGTSIVDLL